LIIRLNTVQYMYRLYNLYDTYVIHLLITYLKNHLLLIANYLVNFVEKFIKKNEVE
jgi:hypothetical protein